MQNNIARFVEIWENMSLDCSLEIIDSTIDKSIISDDNICYYTIDNAKECRFNPKLSLKIIITNSTLIDKYFNINETTFSENVIASKFSNHATCRIITPENIEIKFRSDDLTDETISNIIMYTK